MLELNHCYCADAIAGIKQLEPESVNCCVTSPPYYGLRDYGIDGQIGLESTPGEYITKLVNAFHEIWRVLRNDGTLWVNIADSYAGSGKGAWSNTTAQKETYVPNPQGAEAKIAKTFDGIKAKNLIGIPWALAFALRDNGWYLRQDIIWQKPNAMPESVTDRCTKSHEYIFLLSKQSNYYFDSKAISEPVSPRTIFLAHRENPPRYGGNKYTKNPDKFCRTKSGNAYGFHERRNKRDVWDVPTKPFKEAHFATFPPELIKPCILAGCPENGVVLDPFMGSGTTGVTAAKLNRNFIGFDLNPDYCNMANRRTEPILAQLHF
jgi:DNA modification methylase